MFAANKTRHRLSGVGGGFMLFEAGTSSFVVPAGVISISAVAIGGGGGGRNSDSTTVREGGGGGALAWSSSILVTAGETLTLVVGASGFGGSPASSGTASSISRGGTTLLSAAAGTGAAVGVAGVGGAASASVGTNRFSGGDGNTAGALPNGGGGGAGGYYGNGGGNQGSGNSNGAGGGGGMGGNLTVTDQGGEQVSGGGTFPFGFSGFSGPRGADNARGFMGSSAAGTTELRPFNGVQSFGFGGGGSVGVGYTGGRGGTGAIRILWNTENAITSCIPPATPTIISSQFFQVNASTPPSPTIPAGVQVGDIVIVYTSYVRTDSVNPSASGIPTNFTDMRQSALSASGTYRAKYALSKRLVLDAAIAGTTIVIPSEPSGTLVVGVFVLRSANGVNPFLSTSGITERGIQTTNISMNGSQSFNATNQTTKGIPISFAFFVSYDGYPTGTVTWSGSTQITTGISTLGFFYKIYPFSATSTDDNITVTGGTGPRSGVLLALTGY